MIFTSIAYLLFLSVTVAAYYLLPGRFRWLWLALASLAYYLSFIPIFMALIGILVIGNYLGGRWIFKANQNGRGKSVLIFLIVVNVLVLAFFKYFNYFFPDLRVELYFVDWFYRVDPICRMIIPLGLSYLLFTVISYQIEIKRKTIVPERHFGYFSLYLLFFPRIAQGPIERPQKLLTQLREIHPLDYDLVTNGMKLILWGFFKKLVVADRLAIYVNAVYNNSEHHNGTTLLIATIFFAFQIYADFSGYTDIALGSAQLFGIRLTDNFNRPYFATSIKEFWNRWHITFSVWLRDYLFLPLAFFFSKRMKKKTYILVATEKWIYLFSIMITFAICGIWHGEGSNFLIWGILFGTYLTIEQWSIKFNKRIRKKIGWSKNSSFNVVVKTMITFSMVTFAWIFFRASGTHEAFTIIQKIIFLNGPIFVDWSSTMPYSLVGIFFLIVIEIKEEYYKGAFSFMNHPNVLVRYLTYTILCLTILLLGVFDGGQFIYFQF